MKVLIDENLSPALARSLSALFAGEHEITHLRERFGPSVTDLNWISALSSEGRWIVISGDRRITRNRAEYHAFRQSRLVGFFFSRALVMSRVIKQMERLLFWWERLEQQARLVEGGAMFEIPMKGSRLRQIRL